MPQVDTAYRAKRAVALGNVVAETTFKTADDVTKPALVYLKGSGAYDGQGIFIKARGILVAGATTSLTVQIRQGTTIAGVALASSGAVTSGGAGNFNWELNFEGTWDAVSKRIRGRLFGHIADTAVAEAINTTAITAVDPTGDNLPFCLTALLSVSNAGNDVRLTEFLAGTS